MSVQPLEFVYGINAVGEMIKHNAKAIETIYVVDARDDKRVRKIVEMAEQARLTLTKSSKDDIEAMLASDTEHSVNHQGVIAACRPSQAKDEDFLEALLSRAEQPLSLLILDGVTDPHNLGACLRSADAAGVDAVVGESTTFRISIAPACALSTCVCCWPSSYTWQIQCDLLSIQ